MLADTSAVHAFGDALSRHAEVLDAARAALTSAHPGADALGPAGARFTSALADAVRLHTSRVAELSQVVAGAAATARVNAAEYLAADDAGGRAIGEV